MGHEVRACQCSIVHLFDADSPHSHLVYSSTTVWPAFVTMPGSAHCRTALPCISLCLVYMAFFNGAAGRASGCSGSACRYLASAPPTSFIDHLAGETPASHMVELWSESKSGVGIVQWLMAAMRWDKLLTRESLQSHYAFHLRDKASLCIL
jgi:hypothetical protein